MSIQPDQMGPAGIRGELNVLAQMQNESRSDKARLHDVSLREFNLFALLSKTPPTAENIKGDFKTEDGSSFLMVPLDTELMRIQCQDGIFEIKKNTLGELAMIEFKCSATTTAEVKRKFYQAALPFFDFIAYSSNSPIYITTIRIEDSKNDRQMIEYISPYRKATVLPRISNLVQELLPVYAMFREAKNSHSDFYKFLCYHKILEGLFGTLRTDLFQKAKAKGIILTKPRDIVPNTNDLSGPYKAHIGKPIKDFFDNVLEPRFRNSVAHFTTKDGAVLNMSAPDHIKNFEEVLYITELCVRTAIENFRAMAVELNAT